MWDFLKKIRRTKEISYLNVRATSFKECKMDVFTEIKGANEMSDQMTSRDVAIKLNRTHDSVMAELDALQDKSNIIERHDEEGRYYELSDAFACNVLLYELYHEQLSKSLNI